MVGGHTHVVLLRNELSKGKVSVCILGSDRQLRKCGAPRDCVLDYGFQVVEVWLLSHTHRGAWEDVCTASQYKADAENGAARDCGSETLEPWWQEDARLGAGWRSGRGNGAKGIYVRVKRECACEKRLRDVPAAGSEEKA